MFDESIRLVLRDFCHVEWYEVEELALLVRGGVAKFNVNELRGQFESLMSRPEGIAVLINELTANEFESDDEARVWLEGIFRKVFE